MREIKQIRRPGRERPYVTIVDTGLAMAVQNFLASLYLGLLEGEDLRACIVEDELLDLANRLANELRERTF